MKKTTIIATAIVLPLLATSASAFAFGGGQGNKGHHGDKGGRGSCEVSTQKLLRKLDLTDEQKAELKTLRESQREVMKTDRAENKDTRKAHREAVEALMLSADFDEAAAQALAEEMTEQQQQRHLNRLEQGHAVMSVLTEEQKAELQTLKAERMERCEQKAEERRSRPKS